MEIRSASQVNKAVLGEGFNSKNEDFVGECATGNVVFVGVPESTVLFSKSMSETEVSDSLGFSIGGSARFGIVSTSLSARFASEASANDYSEVTIYSSEYRFKNKKLTFTGLTDVGKQAKGFSTGPFLGENWELTCGHEYVEQITLGAAIFISAKIEFSSKADKENFNAEFQVKGPAFSASGEFEKASKSFSSSASIIIQAYQMGGDVSRISSIFGSGDSASTVSPDGKNIHALLACSMSNPGACLQILTNALKYATDTTNPAAFPQQISPQSDISDPTGPAELSYITSPWSDLSLFPAPPIINDLIKAAREELSNEFEKNFAFRNRIRALKTTPIRLSARQRKNIETIDKDITFNLKLINEAAVVCYTTIDRSSEKVAEIKQKLKSIDEENLNILPESIAQWCDIKDLPNTKKSTQNTINSLFELVKSIVVDFDNVEDKSLTVERTLLTFTELSLVSELELDLEPLADLKNLKILRLKGCKISDISALSKLEKLEQIELGSNRISDISPLSKLLNLTEIELFDNQISDLNPLSLLSKLLTLNIFSNKISDISPLNGLLNLEKLILFDNQISDATDLSSLVNLTLLDLGKNQITNVDYLSTLVNLTGLNLVENLIVNQICPVPDLNPRKPICKF